MLKDEIKNSLGFVTVSKKDVLAATYLRSKWAKRQIGTLKKYWVDKTIEEMNRGWFRRFSLFGQYKEKYTGVDAINKCKKTLDFLGMNSIWDTIGNIHKDYLAKDSELREIAKNLESDSMLINIKDWASLKAHLKLKRENKVVNIVTKPPKRFRMKMAKTKSNGLRINKKYSSY